MSQDTWVPVARFADLREEDVLAADAAGLQIALFLVGGEVFATDNLCTHGAARLSDGFVIDHCVECPLHQGQFDIRTGAPLCDPVTEPVRVYPVRLAGDVVEVLVADRS